MKKTLKTGLTICGWLLLALMIVLYAIQNMGLDSLLLRNEPEDLPLEKSDWEDLSKLLSECDGIPVKLKVLRNLKSGELTVEITRATVYESVEAAKIEGDDIIENGWLDLNTGDLMDGVCFLVLDVKVKNEDAIGSEYLRGDLFRADSLFWFVKPVTGYSKRGNTIMVIGSTPDYFSELGERPEGSLAFQLANGEEISFRVGYFYKPNGAISEELFLCTNYSSGELNKLSFVNLN